MARRIGNSIGVIFPAKLVKQLNVSPGDDVDVNVRRAVTLGPTFGMLRKYGLTVEKWNDLTHEGEDL